MKLENQVYSLELAKKLKEKREAVLGYEKLYEVSNLGAVRSLARNTTSGRVLKQNRSRFYLSVCLSNKNKYRTFATHRLVAQAFIKNPENKPYVNHKNGNKYDNQARNLEWTTPSENKTHAVKNGFTYSPKGRNHWNAKLTEYDVVLIRRNAHKPLKELAKQFKVSIQTVSDIINRKKWKHI